MKVIDITGMRFERLLVTGHIGKKTSSRNHYWKVVCDCGEIREVNGSDLRNGLTKSCGCLSREKARSAGDRTRTHGLSKTSIYSIWDSMIQRCHNPNRKDFKNYGGKGILVCERWLTGFDFFLEDMGDRPAGASIDRIDTSKGYTPENCRWATTKEQARNRTDNRLLTVDGVTRCIADWAERIGMNPVTLHARLLRGWNDEKAIKTPVLTKYKSANTKLTEGIVYA